MSRRGTKRERHLAHFKETGQMTAWLERRLSWDTKMREALFDEMYGRTVHASWYARYLQGSWVVNNPRSYVKITGLTLPTGDEQ